MQSTAEFTQERALAGSWCSINDMGTLAQATGIFYPGQLPGDLGCGGQLLQFLLPPGEYWWECPLRTYDEFLKAFNVDCHHFSGCLIPPIIVQS